MTLSEYLDAAKVALGVTSDYALAKHLGTTTSRVGNWRSGRNLPDMEMCLALAQILNMKNVVPMIADVEMQRTKSARLRSMWAEIGKTGMWKVPKKVAMVALGAIGLHLAPVPAPAATSHNQNVETASGIHIARQRRRRRESGWSLTGLLAQLAAL